jgi:hypothetical protein
MGSIWLQLDPEWETVVILIVAAKMELASVHILAIWTQWTIMFATNETVAFSSLLWHL